MGLTIDHPFILGQDLVNAKEGFAAFTAYLFEGSFIHNNVMFEISREGVFEGSRAWDVGTHEELDGALFEEEYNRAVKIKKTSKEILDRDLIGEYMEGKNSHNSIPEEMYKTNPVEWYKFKE
jgi:hypothetical protein